MKNIALSTDDVLDSARVAMVAAKQELRALSEVAAVDPGPNYRFDRNEIYRDREFPKRQSSCEGAL